MPNPKTILSSKDINKGIKLDNKIDKLHTPKDVINAT